MAQLMARMMMMTWATLAQLKKIFLMNSIKLAAMLKLIAVKT
jgi:hypothetical protein